MVLFDVTLSGLQEANMSRFHRIWVTVFTAAVTCSLLFSSVAFAINDPK
jgi:hypothetical protein